MKNKVFVFAGGLALLVIALSCSTDKKPAGPAMTEPVADAMNVVRDTTSGSLTLHGVGGDTLQVLFNPVFMHASCNGNTLEHDTTDTVFIAYLLTGDSLTTYSPNGNGDIDTNRYARIGSGSGLIGNWKDSLVDFRSGYQDTVLETIVIGSDSSFRKTSLRRINFVHYYRTHFLTDALLQPESVSLETPDVMTLAIKGLITLETDTIRMLQNRDVLFTSSTPANAPHTYYYSPASCPNLTQPAWFDSLLNNNRK
ncbi:MAG: hypothetical protein V1913_13415 [Fibrobacterota bacterium]